MTDTHLTAPTRFIEVDGDRFAYRRWGKPSGVPLFFVPHFRAGLDHWDPLLTDGLAESREVILFNGRGIASSSGTPRNRMEDLADDIAAVIQALGLPKSICSASRSGACKCKRSRCAIPHWCASCCCSAPAFEAAIRRWIPRCLTSRRLLFRPLRTSSSSSLVARTPRNRPASRSGNDAISESTRTRQVQLQSLKLRLKHMRPIWYRCPVRTPMPT